MTSIVSHARPAFFESPWKQVVVHRKDKFGQVIYWKPVDGQPGKYIKTYGIGSPDLIYTEDTRTGELYKGGVIDDDSQYVVRVKALVASLINPFFAISHMSWYGVKGIYTVAQHAMAAFQGVGQRAASQSFVSALLHNGRTFVQKSASSLARNTWRVVRTPLYGIAMQVTLCATVVLGYEGRKWEAMAEKAMQKHSWKRDWRMMKAPESLGKWTAFKQDVKDAKACYLAFCFQPRGNIKDTKRFIKIRYEN